MERLQARVRNAYKIILPALFILSLFQFLIYYTVYGAYFESEAVFYLGNCLEDFIDGSFPIIAALAVFLIARRHVTKLLFSLLIATAKLAYLVPYYYLYFIYDVYDSLESLLLSLLLSLMTVVGIAAEIFIITLIMTFAERRAKCEGCAPTPDKIFNFNSYMNFGIVLSVIFTFVIAFVRECISAVEFFIEYATSFTAGEVFSIFASFIILILFAFLYYIAAAKIKNVILTVKEV